MHGVLRTSAALLCMVVLPLLLVACDGETCEGACNQVYGSGEGQCNQDPISSGTGTTQAEAITNCVRDCQEALYTTSSAEESGNSTGGIQLMSNETDALDFIHCVVDNDFTGAPDSNPGAETCENLRFLCDRIRW
jgi:hypothetical protein